VEPLISLRLVDRRHRYLPGDLLTCQCQIDAVAAEDVAAIETSVLWRTEGKGDEDMGLAFFLRRTREDPAKEDLRRMSVVTLGLPASPLSYDGVIVKVQWLARVRVQLRRGKWFSAEIPFVLGDVRPGQAIAAPEAHGEGDTDSAGAEHELGI